MVKGIQLHTHEGLKNGFIRSFQLLSHKTWINFHHTDIKDKQIHQITETKKIKYQVSNSNY